jgi:sodium/potassium/calcium exchanger 5
VVKSGNETVSIEMSSRRESSVTTENAENNEDEEEKPANPFEMPEKWFMKIVHVVLFPISLLFFLTVPDSRRPFFQPFPRYFLGFIVSAAYVGVLTYLLVWMVVVLIYTLGIPDTVAGLTILAAGTSVPEVVAGIIVTRKV